MIAPRVIFRSPGRRIVSSPRARARQDMIRTAAYLLAEQRGFSPGRELDDWLAAERQIDSVLASHAAKRRDDRLSKP